MNKKIYLCAVAALALASCSNDETVEIAKGDAINFRTSVGLNTRASEFGTADLEQVNKLYVTTFKADGTELYTETEYTKGVDGWAGNQFWGTEASLNFYLTYPKLSEWKNNAELTKDNKTISGFTVNDAVANQVDFVAAQTTAQKAASVTVELQHVLSQIQINAKSDNANYKYKVRGIRIHNANSTGNIDLSTQTWSSWSAAKNYEVTFTTPVELNGTVQSIMGDAGNAMLLPQTVEAWNGTDKSDDTVTPVTGSYISVLVSITTNAGTGVYPKNTTDAVPTYGWAAVPVKFEWTNGNKYIYTLDFTKGAGKVDPVDPNEKDKDDVKPGKPDKDPEKTEPILGDEIKFTVTVNPWTLENKNQEM